ncbi:hypothetical protein [uncultured Microbulbifer sp.]|uniref:hypothetical protein n=1 Tax=uncultured Microbulbifer sp. TaxID=348147 RepID=UPI0026330636|nr:hypothetical protein [uncultured Microbulbifer sp.]
MQITFQGDTTCPLDKVSTALEPAQHQRTHAIQCDICFSRNGTHWYFRSEHPLFDKHTCFSFKPRDSQPSVPLVDGSNLTGIGFNTTRVKLLGLKRSGHKPTTLATQGCCSLHTPRSIGWYRMVLRVGSISCCLLTDIVTLNWEYLLARNCYIKRSKLPSGSLQWTPYQTTAVPRQAQAGSPSHTFRELAAIHLLAGSK